MGTGNLKVGDSAPDFEALDVGGLTVTLASMYKKNDLVLLFFRGTW